MAESSRPWQFGVGDGIGAAADGSYTADQWDNIFHAAFQAGSANYGVLRGQGNQLLVAATAPASNQVTVGTGAALVHGIFYENTTAVTFPAAGFPAPAAAARYDRIVLRANWAARTVRITRLPGVEGAGVPPALTQVDGVTWDLPLAIVYLAFPWGGVINAADIANERYFVEPRQREFDAIVGPRPGDYATLTAAVADGHRSIFVRAGTYVEPGNVTLTSGMWLCGEDRDNTILDFGANQLLVNEAAANYADHVLIENLQFRSTNAAGSVALQRSRYGTIRHNAWDSNNGLTEGLFMTADALEHSITDNWLDATTGVGIYVRGLSHVIHGNRLNACIIYGDATANGTVCSDNVVQGAAASAIELLADYVRIVGNVVSTAGGGSGIVAAGNFGIIDGNTASGCDQYGIIVQGNGVTVSNNEVDSTVTLDGIYIDGTNAIVEGNQSHGGAAHGISFSGGGDYGVCKGNQCYDNGGAGINLAAGADQIVVGDNVCRGNTGWGIDYAGDRDIVLGNIALTNGAGQIDATGATNQDQAHNIVA